MESSELNPTGPLPTQRDFDPWGGNLDAQEAWRNFGGLTLEQAIEKFSENPLRYQEDFMFMGGKAFAYYFPVVENHLRSVPDAEGDQEAWILAQCVRFQFLEHDHNLAILRHLAPRVIELAEFVCGNSRRFGGWEDERRRSADAWAELASEIEAARKQ